MALKDVKQYYYTMLNQYLECKEDLADFEAALKDGFITEDHLEQIMEEFTKVQQNVERLAYILFLFELPKKKKTRQRTHVTDEKLMAYFEENGASQAKVVDENYSAIQHIKDEIKRLSKLKQISEQ